MSELQKQTGRRPRYEAPLLLALMLGFMSLHRILHDDLGTTKIAFAFIGFAFVALNIWLSVRLFKRAAREVRLIVVVFVVVPWMYLLSFGPMLFLGRNGFLPEWLGAVGIIYGPLIRFLNRAPEWASAPFNWFYAIFQ